MDHQEEKALHKKQERKQDNREQKTGDDIRARQDAKGARKIRPLWLGFVGFVLAMLSLFFWMFWL